MRDGEPTVVLSVNTHYSERRSITVKPVLSTSKTQARKKLLEEGISLICNWLQNAAINEDGRYRRLEILFDPVENKLTTESWEQFAS